MTPGLLFYLVEHLREKWFRVRPHIEIFQLKADSHSRHLNFFICKGPKDEAQTTEARWEPARMSSVAGCGQSPLPSSGADLGGSGLSSGSATKQPPGPALSLSTAPPPSGPRPITDPVPLCAMTAGVKAQTSVSC